MRLIETAELEELYAEQLTLGNDPDSAFWDALFDCKPVNIVQCKDCAMYTGKYCTLTNDEEDERDPDDFCSHGDKDPYGALEVNNG